MIAVLRSFFVIITIGSVVILGTACGGSDSVDEGAGGGAADVAAGPASSAPGSEETGETSAPKSEAVSVSDAFKAMAASEGIFFGEVPEGFPLNIIPVHPEGEIDKSSIDEDGFTLLQNVNKDTDSVLGYFVNHFDGLGWSAGAPFSMGDRTMVSFEGPDGGVDMTMIDQGNGRTFVALALSQ